jgi:hypothetical protein
MNYRSREHHRTQAIKEIRSVAKELRAAKPQFEKFVHNEVFSDLSHGPEINGMMTRYKNMGLFRKYGIDPTNPQHLKAVEKEIQEVYESEIEDAIGAFRGFVFNVTH